MEDAIEVREVKIQGKGMEPHNYEVIDVETGKTLEGVRSIGVDINVNNPPRVTIEQHHIEGPELNIQAKATIRKNDHRFEDSSGRVWLEANELARMIREKGSLCWRGKSQAVTCEFSEDLLRVWEGNKPAPAEGQNKETASHG